MPNWNMDQPVRGHHYSESTPEYTVFGEESQGLSYDYSDRFRSFDRQKHDDAIKTANASGAKRRSPRWFQEYLSAFFGKKVTLKHIIIGSNRSNGFPYDVFGYVMED